MELATVRKASEELGVSRSLLRQLAAKKKIPFYRLSERTLRFDLNELRDYMRFVAGGKSVINEEHGR